MAFGYKIYFSDRFNHRVICWDPDTGESKVVAGESKDNSLREPYGLAMDSEKNLLIADKYHHRVCRLRNGKLEKIPTYDPDSHRKCRFHNPQNNPESPTGVFFEKAGTLLVAYSDDHTIYRVHQDGKLELVLGIPVYRYYAFKGCLAHVAPEKIGNTPISMPTSVVAKDDGTIFFIERGYQTVREYHPERGLHSLFPYALRKKFEKIQQAPQSTDKDSYYPPSPSGLSLGNGSLFLADLQHRCVFELHLRTGQMKQVMETPQTVSQRWIGPVAITLGADGTLWVLDVGEKCIFGFQKHVTGFWKKIDQKYMITKWEVSCSKGCTGMVCG